MAARKGVAPVPQKSLGIFGAVPVPIVGVTPQGLVQELNPSAIDLLAINKGTDAQGKSFVDIFVVEEDRQPFRARFAEALGGASRVGCRAIQVRLTTRNGRKDTLLRISPSRGSDGRIDAIALCLQEASELKSMASIESDTLQSSNAEDAANLSQLAVEGQWVSECLSRILFSAGAAIFTMDSEGLFTAANATCARVFGMPVDELVGTKVFTKISEESVANLREAIGHITAKSRCSTFLAQVITGEDEGVTLGVSLSPQWDGDSNVVGIFAVCVEVPEGLAPVGMAPGASSGAAQKPSMGVVGGPEGQTSDGGTKGMVMHELRSPLHGIIGLTNTLSQDASPMQKPLKMIGGSAVRVLELVTNLLDYWHAAELPALALDECNDTLNIPELVNEALARCEQLVDKRGKPIRKPGVNVVKEISSVLPVIPGDVQNVSQMLYHLFGNAFKFTFSGQVTISVSPGDACVHISVSDTGVGVSEENFDRIFEPFQQEDCSESRKYEGIGLGLAIVREVVRTQGGKIRIISTQDKGSTFTVMLPSCSSETPTPCSPIAKDGSGATLATGCRSFRAAPVRKLSDAPLPTQLAPARRWLGPSTLVKPPQTPGMFHAFHAQQAAAAIQAPTLAARPQPVDPDRPRLIMSVDDDHVNQEVMRSVLEPNGFRTVVCMSGAECLQYIEQEKTNLPDLVLLDLMMPGLNGFDVLQAVRKKFSLEHMPILMVSAKNQVASVVKGLELGCNDWIHKPFDRTELVARVKMQLRTRETVQGYEAMALMAQVNRPLSDPEPVGDPADSASKKPPQVQEEAPKPEEPSQSVVGAPAPAPLFPAKADTCVLFITLVFPAGKVLASEWDKLFVEFDKIAQEVGIKATEFMGNAYVAVHCSEEEDSYITDRILKFGLRVAAASDGFRQGMEYAVGIHQERRVTPVVVGENREVKRFSSNVVAVAKALSECSNIKRGRIRMSSDARSKISSTFEAELMHQGHEFAECGTNAGDVIFVRSGEPPFPEVEVIPPLHARAVPAGPGVERLTVQSQEASAELSRLQAEIANAQSQLAARTSEIQGAESRISCMRNELNQLQQQISGNLARAGTEGTATLGRLQPLSPESKEAAHIVAGPASAMDLGSVPSMAIPPMTVNKAPVLGGPALFLQWQNAHLQAELQACQEELSGVKTELQLARMTVQQAEGREERLIERVEHLELDVSCMTVCTGLRPTHAYLEQPHAKGTNAIPGSGVGSLYLTPTGSTVFGSMVSPSFVGPSMANIGTAGVQVNPQFLGGSAYPSAPA